MSKGRAAVRAVAAIAIAGAGAVSVSVSVSVSTTVPAEAAGIAHIAVIGDSYTTGTSEGGNGPRSWPAQAWNLLAQRGVQVQADIAAEGGAGYGQPGDHGSVFQDLTARAVRRNDALVVFFGSRNDQPVNPMQLPGLTAGAFHLARYVAPDAKVLVIGPPWPSSTPPPAVLTIRDTLRSQAAAIGATFVDPIAEDWFVGRPDLIGRDGVHPTDAGHSFMAGKIAPLVYAQLITRI